MDRKRRRFSPEKKLEILREHLKNKVLISGIFLNVVSYRWIRE